MVKQPIIIIYYCEGLLDDASLIGWLYMYLQSGCPVQYHNTLT